MHSVVLRGQTMGQKANAELELTSLLKRLSRNALDTLTCSVARTLVLLNKNTKLNMINVTEKLT